MSDGISKEMKLEFIVDTSKALKNISEVNNALQKINGIDFKTFKDVFETISAGSKEVDRKISEATKSVMSALDAIDTETSKKLQNNLYERERLQAKVREAELKAKADQLKQEYQLIQKSLADEAKLRAQYQKDYTSGLGSPQKDDLKKVLAEYEAEYDKVARALENKAMSLAPKEKFQTTAIDKYVKALENLVHAYDQLGKRKKDIEGPFSFFPDINGEGLNKEIFNKKDIERLTALQKNIVENLKSAIPDSFQKDFQSRIEKSLGGDASKQASEYADKQIAELKESLDKKKTEYREAEIAIRAQITSLNSLREAMQERERTIAAIRRVHRRGKNKTELDDLEEGAYLQKLSKLAVQTGQKFYNDDPQTALNDIAAFKESVQKGLTKAQSKEVLDILSRAEDSVNKRVEELKKKAEQAKKDAEYIKQGRENEGKVDATAQARVDDVSKLGKAWLEVGVAIDVAVLKRLDKMHSKIDTVKKSLIDLLAEANKASTGIKDAIGAQQQIEKQRTTSGGRVEPPKDNTKQSDLTTKSATARKVRSALSESLDSDLKKINAIVEAWEKVASVMQPVNVTMLQISEYAKSFRNSLDSVNKMNFTELKSVLSAIEKATLKTPNIVQPTQQSTSGTSKKKPTSKNKDIDDEAKELNLIQQRTALLRKMISQYSQNSSIANTPEWQRDIMKVTELTNRIANMQLSINDARASVREFESALYAIRNTLAFQPLINQIAKIKVELNRMTQAVKDKVAEIDGTTARLANEQKLKNISSGNAGLDKDEKSEQSLQARQERAMWKAEEARRKAAEQELNNRTKDEVDNFFDGLSYEQVRLKDSNIKANTNKDRRAIEREKALASKAAQKEQEKIRFLDDKMGALERRLYDSFDFGKVIPVDKYVKLLKQYDDTMRKIGQLTNQKFTADKNPYRFMAEDEIRPTPKDAYDAYLKNLESYNGKHAKALASKLNSLNEIYNNSIQDGTPLSKKAFYNNQREAQHTLQEYIRVCKEAGLAARDLQVANSGIWKDYIKPFNDRKRVSVLYNELNRALNKLREYKGLEGKTFSVSALNAYKIKLNDIVNELELLGVNLDKADILSRLNDVNVKHPKKATDNSTASDDKAVSTTTKHAAAVEKLNYDISKATLQAEAMYMKFAEMPSAINKIRFDLALRQLKELQEQSDGLNRHLNNSATLADRFINTMKTRSRWVFSGMLAGSAMNIPQETVDSYIELEKTVAGVQQVMEAIDPISAWSKESSLNKAEALRTLNNEIQNFVDVSAKYAQNVNDTALAAQLWGRGYGHASDVQSSFTDIYGDTHDLTERQKQLEAMKQVNELVAQSAMLAAVDNFSMEESVKGLEAILSAYGMRAKSAAEATMFASSAVDSLTKVAHTGQISAQDLVQGIEATGQAASQAGISLEFLEAMIETGVRNTGRSGSEIGQAVKALTVGIHSTKGVKELEKFGIQVMKIGEDGSKRMRPLQEVILDISNALQKSDKNAEKLLLAVSGGRYQYSKISSILRDRDEIIRMWGNAINSSGFAKNQLSLQMDTIASKLKKIRAELVGLVQDAVAGSGGNIVKNLLDMIDWLIRKVKEFSGAIKDVSIVAIGVVGVKMLTKLGAAFKRLTGMVIAYNAALKESNMTAMDGVRELAAQAGASVKRTASKATGIGEQPKRHVNADFDSTINKSVNVETASIEKNTNATKENDATKKASIVTTKAHTTATKAGAVAQDIAVVATNTETLALTRQAMAMTLATAGLNILIGVVATAAVAAYDHFNGEVEKSVYVMKDSREEFEDVTSSTIESAEQMIQALKEEVEQREQQVAFLENARDRYIELKASTDQMADSDARKNENTQRMIEIENNLSQVLGQAALDRLKEANFSKEAWDSELETFKDDNEKKKQSLNDLEFSVSAYYTNQYKYNAWMVDQYRQNIDNFKNYVGMNLDGLGTWKSGWVKFMQFLAKCFSWLEDQFKETGGKLKDLGEDMLKSTNPLLWGSGSALLAAGNKITALGEGAGVIKDWATESGVGFLKDELGDLQGKAAEYGSHLSAGRAPSYGGTPDLGDVDTSEQDEKDRKKAEREQRKRDAAARKAANDEKRAEREAYKKKNVINYRDDRAMDYVAVVSKQISEKLTQGQLLALSAIVHGDLTGDPWGAYSRYYESGDNDLWAVPQSILDKYVEGRTDEESKAWALASYLNEESGGSGDIQKGFLNYLGIANPSISTEDAKKAYSTMLNEGNYYDTVNDEKKLAAPFSHPTYSGSVSTSGGSFGQSYIGDDIDEKHLWDLAVLTASKAQKVKNPLWYWLIMMHESARGKDGVAVANHNFAGVGEGHGVDMGTDDNFAEQFAETIDGDFESEPNDTDELAYGMHAHGYFTADPSAYATDLRGIQSEGLIAQGGSTSSTANDPNGILSGGYDVDDQSMYGLDSRYITMSGSWDNIENLQPYVRRLINIIANRYFSATGGQKLAITSLTGGSGHSTSPWGHYAGYKADLSIDNNEAVLKSILGDYGVSAAVESGTHYDVSFGQGNDGRTVDSASGPLVGDGTGTEAWNRYHNGPQAGASGGNIKRNAYNWIGGASGGKLVIGNWQANSYSELEQLDKLQKAMFDVQEKRIKRLRDMGETPEADTAELQLSNAKVALQASQLKRYRSIGENAYKEYTDYMSNDADVQNALKRNGKKLGELSDSDVDKLIESMKNSGKDTEHIKNIWEIVKGFNYDSNGKSVKIESINEELNNLRLQLLKNRGYMSPKDRENYELESLQSEYEAKRDMGDPNRDQTYHEKRLAVYQQRLKRLYEQRKVADADYNSSVESLRRDRNVQKRVVSDLEDRQKNGEDVSDKLAHEKEALKNINAAYEETLKYGTLSQRGIQKEIDATTKLAEEEKKQVQELRDKFKEASADLTNDFFDKLINGGKDLKSILEDIRKEIAKIALKRLVNTAFGVKNQWGNSSIETILQHLDRSRKRPTATTNGRPQVADFLPTAQRWQTYNPFDPANKKVSQSSVDQKMKNLSNQFKIDGDSLRGKKINNITQAIQANTNAVNAAKDASTVATTAQKAATVQQKVSTATTQSVTADSIAADMATSSIDQSTTQQRVSSEASLKTSVDNAAATVQNNASKPAGSAVSSGGGIAPMGYVGMGLSLVSMFKKADGGLIPTYATGGDTNGLIRGAGTGTSDSILTYLANRGQFIRTSNGEYIIKKDTVDKVGVPFLDKLNQNPEVATKLQAYSEGGALGDVMTPTMRPSTVASYKTYTKNKAAVAKTNTSRLESLMAEQTSVIKDMGKSSGDSGKMIIVNAQADSNSIMRAIAKDPKTFQRIMNNNRRHGFRG